MQIRAKNIVKIFNKKLPTELKALNNVSVEIKENEFIAIIGQTGSGKTTFIEHMNVLLTPDEGEVEFVYKAKDPKTQEVEVIKNIIQKPKSFQKKLKFIKEIRRRVGVVFQFAEYQLFEQTIEKDIIFGAVSMGTPKAEAKERAKEIIKLVGLDESYLPKSPFNLSGGQKRRVAIAGILAMEPDIIFFDEPTAGLDPAGTDDMLLILNNLYESGKTIILATHDLDNVLKWTKRTIVFKNGEIVKDGDTFSILSDNQFLKDNQMMPTNLLYFVEKLRKRGLDIQDVSSLEELAEAINLKLKGKHAN
ncbi:ATP-binding cassette domain-containing protein [Mesomycoplasma hyorhinis]|uniref:ATP-binding cassette domain-containing protein n=3 Tax=Mesomycoplasma hyorhinis TaxID=2100 RepID=A0ABD6IH53_MESHY|nr:ATP-binding cassette domain-containing protein [Mesomycoplasma hyorhinis]AEC45872.1 ABC transporter, ATP-binding protein [Mesomycoplasma hyorhinis MCLD]AEX13913.1 ABC transporter, ATP-binding protein [Mesomycoplasma hyorhinis GDL-1]AFX74053.1 ATPase component of general energizing module of ECF transporter [Mesomycoplasma hyorhinis SK76]AHA40875.1 ABC transporter ATP-binding protein [Mesomycoplasma hyorhinis DBS 1050]AOD25118.1 ABC transporter, ATP-binding protein [Mesomycoplasma hyorhinis]